MDADDFWANPTDIVIVHQVKVHSLNNDRITPFPIKEKMTHTWAFVKTRGFNWGATPFKLKKLITGV
jgi:hypothetical protein